MFALPGTLLWMKLHLDKSSKPLVVGAALNQLVRWLGSQDGNESRFRSTQVQQAWFVKVQLLLSSWMLIILHDNSCLVVDWSSCVGGITLRPSRMLQTPSWAISWKELGVYSSDVTILIFTGSKSVRSVRRNSTKTVRLPPASVWTSQHQRINEPAWGWPSTGDRQVDCKYSCSACTQALPVGKPDHVLIYYCRS